jgi:hypothetical protein
METGPSQERKSSRTFNHWDALGESSFPWFFQMSQCTQRALHNSVSKNMIETGRQRWANRPPAKERKR